MIEEEKKEKTILSESEETPEEEPEKTEAQEDAAEKAQEGETEEEKEEETAEFLRDKLMRALAEMENMRKRADQSMEEQRRYAVAEMARAFLSVGDHMDMALDALEGEKKDTAVLLKTLGEGIKATKREFIEVLKRFGVSEISAKVGESFSYDHHEAVQREVHPQSKEGDIVRILRKGYTIHDRLLRASMVVVSSGGEPPATEPIEKKEKVEDKKNTEVKKENKEKNRS